MAGLTGETIAGTYKSLLRTEDNSAGVSNTLKRIQDGEGTSSCAEIADDAFRITPQDDDGTGVFSVRDKDSNYLLRVNSDDDVVKVNGGQEIANTQYAYFGVNYVDFSDSAANTHMAIPFGAAGGGATGTNDVDFGTSTDPATTFTTADTDTQYASQIVPMMWFVPDNITINSVTAIEGADNATGDTTRLHLFSYTFNTGSTSCLTAGTLLAHNSDVTNAGNEQAYKTTFTIDSADVDGGKVILAFMRSDSVNSDYSVNITVKYHLR